MKWNPLGDSALTTECFHAAAVAQSLREDAPEECIDIVSSYRHLAVYFSPQDADFIRTWLENTEIEVHETSPHQHQIPVCYDSQWLAELSEALQLSEQEIISLHSSTTYTVAALGFSPGFPYLTGLPPELHLPRKTTPARLPAGTVAIAAGQAGIYPNDSFGGWHPLGLTDTPLFNPLGEPHTLLQPGDQITFSPSSEKRTPTPFLSPREEDSSIITVESAGPSTSLQAPGRIGVRHLGVTPGGLADPEMAAALNLLLGNPKDSPILEFALEAPILHFTQATEVAFLGPYHPRAGRIVTMKAGTVLDLKNHAMQSSFGTLAINGGFAVAEILGSAATDLRGGFGGKIINAGDNLHQGSHSSAKIRIRKKPLIHWPLLSTNSLTVRILPAEQSDWFPEDWTDSSFQKTAQFDRTAARLSGPSLTSKRSEELTSRPISSGAIQVPPDGTATVLLPECQTIGGYPLIAHIISADLPAFTRAKPGTRIYFQKVTIEEAQRAFEIQQRELAFLRCGLNFSK